MKFIIFCSFLAVCSALPHQLMDITSNDLQITQKVDEKSKAVSGFYQWMTPTGEHLYVSYIADENGFRVLDSNAIPVTLSGVKVDGNQGSFSDNDYSDEDDGIHSVENDHDDGVHSVEDDGVHSVEDHDDVHSVEDHDDDVHSVETDDGVHSVEDQSVSIEADGTHSTEYSTEDDKHSIENDDKFSAEDNSTEGNQSFETDHSTENDSLEHDDTDKDFSDEDDDLFDRLFTQLF